MKGVLLMDTVLQDYYTKLEETVHSYSTSSDIARIRSAFELAVKWHDGDRKSVV